MAFKFILNQEFVSIKQSLLIKSVATGDLPRSCRAQPTKSLPELTVETMVEDPVALMMRNDDETQQIHHLATSRILKKAQLIHSLGIHCATKAKQGSH